MNISGISSRLVFIILLIQLVSCKQEGKERTTVQTTDVEIPERPPVQAQAPVSADRVPTIDEFRKACLDGNISLVSNYIEAGLNINESDQDGRNGLMLACFNGHLDITRLLLENDAKVNTMDSVGRTALMYASTGHFPRTVELLLTEGADPNIVDKDEGFTALMFAAAEGNSEVVRLLLKHNADPSITDKDGDNAASFALQNGHTEVAKILRESGS